MRHSFIVISLVVLFVCGLAPTADAVILDFDALATGTFTQVTEDGFNITHYGSGDLQEIYDIGGGNKVLRDSDTTGGTGAEVEITTVSGVPFYFNSLEYNNAVPSGSD